MENEYHHNSEQCIKIILIESDTSESPIHGFSAIEPDLRSESDSSVVWCAPSTDEENETDNEIIRLSPPTDHCNTQTSNEESEASSCNNCKLKSFRTQQEEAIFWNENRRQESATASLSTAHQLQPEHVFVPENLLQNFIDQNRQQIDLDHLFDSGESMLSLTYRHKRYGQFYIMLTNGANPDLIHHGNTTLLHHAAYDGDRLAIKLLNEHFADPFIKNEIGEVAINISMAINYKEATEQLLTRMKDFPSYYFKTTTQDERTLFHYSALFDSSIVNKYMCENVFSYASKKDKYENTAFHYAIIHKRSTIAEQYLLWQVEEIPNSDGNYPVHCIREYNLVKIYLEYNPEQLYKKNEKNENLEEILSRDDRNLLRLIRQDFQLFTSQPTEEAKRRKSEKRTWSDSENVSSE